MFCPRCGSTQEADLKFCKSCGANLYAVRQVVDTRDSANNTEMSKPWFAEMAIHDAESKRRKEELDHRRGIAPQITRYNEIKGGVITSSGGLGIAIFLYFLMQGIILSGSVSPEAAEILSRLWTVGVIPFLIGLALLINGVFVSRKLAEVVRQASHPTSSFPETAPLKLHSADTSEFIPSGVSVTEGTTRHLGNGPEVVPEGAKHRL